MDEKNIRLVVDNSQEPISLADHMRSTSERVEIMALLSQFLQLAKEGKLSTVAVIAKQQGSNEVLYGVAPLSYKRFEMLGILNTMVFLETQKITVQRPVEEPPPKEPSGA